MIAVCKKYVLSKFKFRISWLKFYTDSQGGPGQTVIFRIPHKEFIHKPCGFEL